MVALYHFAAQKLAERGSNTVCLNSKSFIDVVGIAKNGQEILAESVDQVPLYVVDYTYLLTGLRPEIHLNCSNINLAFFQPNHFRMLHKVI
jgi:hypothetical protein